MMQHARWTNSSKGQDNGAANSDLPKIADQALYRRFHSSLPSTGKMSVNQASLVVGNMKNVGTTLVVGLARHTSIPRSDLPKNLDHNNRQSTRNRRLTHSRGDNGLVEQSQGRNRSQSLDAAHLTVWFHELGSYSEDIVIDSAAFAGLRVGNVYELQPVRKNGDVPKLIFMVGPKNLLDKGVNSSPAVTAASNTGAKPKTAFQISLISSFQKLLDIPPRSAVQVKQVVDISTVELDTIEINLKDVNFGRDSQWSLASSMVNTCCYVDQRVTFLGNRIGSVKCLFKNGKQISSGYIGANTSVVFRSESAKLVFLVQLSREMWHFEENGEILFHRLVNTLFPMIFKKWRSNNSHHSITIVLFTSVDYTRAPWESLGGGERPSQCQDYYRVVVDQVSVFNWDNIMANLRLEFANFKRDILLQVSGAKAEIKGEPCPSVKGNLLEAINLSLTLVCDRFRNTDLRHSINHLVVVSPGSGLFDVDFDMMVETSKKMFSLDCALDIICLSQPPLHTVPLFRYRDNHGEVRHCVPKWCDMSFYAAATGRFSQWIPRCKIYELQMMGLMGNESNKFHLERLHFELKNSIVEAMDEYDENMYHPVNRKPLVSFSASKNLTKAAKDRDPNVATLLLMGARDAPGLPKPPTAPKLNAFMTNSSAQGHVTNVSNTSSALSRLYNLNKTEEGKNKFPVRSRIVLAPAGPRSVQSQKSFSDASVISSRSPHMSSEAFIKKKSAIAKQTGLGTNRGSASKPERNDSVVEAEKVEREDNNPYFKSIMNPSKAQSSEIEKCSRWSGVFPRKIKRKLFKWRSLKAPAALPIATTLFPTSSELETEYSLHNYVLSLSYENRLELKKTRELMREMIRLRLAMGFQICYGDRVKKIESERKTGGYSENIIKYYPKADCVGAIMYLSLNDEIHRIFYDYSGTINVQLYHKIEDKQPSRILLGSRKGTKEAPLIRTRYANEYMISKVNWRHTKPLAFNWNQFDQLLAGYEDALTEIKSDFHKMKFVIMPAETPNNTIQSSGERLTDEEIRLEGLQKLINLIEKGRYVDTEISNAKLKEDFLPEIHFYTGNLYDFLQGEAENFDISGTRPTNSLMMTDGLRFNTNIKLPLLAQQLQGEGGLKLVDRTWHFKFHPHCFLGSELVSWLIKYFEDINTREEAVEYGQSLKDRNLFDHVERRHGFLDGHYFYEFTAEYADKNYVVKQNSTGWFKKITSHEKESLKDKEIIQETEVEPLLESNFNSPLSLPQSQTPTLSKTESELFNDVDKMPELKTVLSHIQRESESSSLTDSQKLKRPKKFLISKKVKYNCDPLHKSFRPELMDVHYDTVHNPEHCFHIRLQWLNTTTKFIDEVIIAWGRLCERYGLKLVETPWRELCTIPELNPFHSFVDLKLALNPLTDEEFKSNPVLQSNKFYFHLHLLNAVGFLLDNRGTSFFSKENIEICYSWGKSTFKFAQFIHKTGAYIVELRDNGDFFMAPNNVHILRVNTLISSLPEKGAKLNIFDSQKVMLDFRERCKDEIFLRELFREAASFAKENYDREFEVNF